MAIDGLNSLFYLYFRKFQAGNISKKS